MNELAKVCSDLQQSGSEVRNQAKTIYALCRSVTPQFYKHTTDEMNAMVNSVQLLIQGIREDVLAKMCQIAVREYPKARAENKNAFFDINYILSFYSQAWNEARPEGFDCICNYEKRGDKVRVSYCRDDDYDYETKTVKLGAEVWCDER